MTGLLIFSFILITLHVFSLRAIIKTNNEEAILENVKKMEGIPSLEDKPDGVPVSLLLPVILILALSFIEIGYFVFAVFLLKDFALIIGSSVLTGYNFYALAKFFPKLKILLKSPVEYFKEKSDTFDNVLNFIMAVFEIIFCIYVIIKIFLRNNYF
jgi:hypothetical protein